MNWFTRDCIEQRTAQEKQNLLDQDGGCEHVEKDINVAYAVRWEKDTFGPVSSYVCCKECDAAAAKEADEEECTCRDCKQRVKAKDGIRWKWFDFYAPQGDEPIFVCNGCRGKETHLARLSQDKADYDAEFGNNIDDDD